MNNDSSSPDSLGPAMDRKTGQPLAGSGAKRKAVSEHNRTGPGMDWGMEPGELPAPDRKIGQTIAYMLQHLNKQLQVSKLAALVNVSPSHFFALFKRQTGCAPIDFFIRLRMQHACQLLDGTSLNVKEVAAVLGYDDPFYFSRTFKAVNRVAPSEYRAMPRQTKDAVRNAALPSALLNAEARDAAPQDPKPAQVRSPGRPDPRKPSPPAPKLLPGKHSEARIIHGNRHLQSRRKENSYQAKGADSYVSKS